MHDFRKLLVWQRAHQLALMVYRITADFPRDEIFGLRHSMRKTAIDIPSFIAEGCGKPSDSEFSRSIAAAVAVAYKLEYHGPIAKDLAFLGDNVHSEFDSELIEVKKML